MPAENKRGEIVMLKKLKQKMVKETTRRKKTVWGRILDNFPYNRFCVSITYYF